MKFFTIKHWISRQDFHALRAAECNNLTSTVLTSHLYHAKDISPFHEFCLNEGATDSFYVLLQSNTYIKHNNLPASLKDLIPSSTKIYFDVKWKNHKVLTSLGIAKLKDFQLPITSILSIFHTSQIMMYLCFFD